MGHNRGGDDARLKRKRRLREAARLAAKPVKSGDEAKAKPKETAR
jgi:hypothetical protein